MAVSRDGNLMNPSCSYSRLVLKATGQIETMLKVVLAPEVIELTALNRSALTVLSTLFSLLQDPPEGVLRKQSRCLSDD